MKNQAILFFEPRGHAFTVINLAKRRGYRCVAITCQKTSMVCVQSAYQGSLRDIDEIVEVCSWSNSELITQQLVSIFKNENVIGIYSGIEPPAVAAAKCRHAFGLRSVEPSTIEQIINKFEFRRKLKTLKLSNLNCIDGRSDFTDLTEFISINKSTFFKPKHGAGSLYVSRCKTPEDFKNASASFCSECDTNPKYFDDYIFKDSEFFLEEEAHGELLSIEGFSQDGIYQPIGLLSRILLSGNEVIEMGSCFPYKHPAEQAIIKKIREVLSAISYDYGPSHIELLVTKDYEIEIIDFNPRFVGADVLQSINFAYGFCFEEFLLQYALGLPVKIDISPRKYSCLQYVLAPEPIEFRGITFPIHDRIKFTSTFKNFGDKIDSVDRQIDYIGCYLVVEDSFNSALNLSKMLRSEIYINGTIPGRF